ncbi:MAG: hypothetical protein KAJ01_03220 [Candidatus Hydrogenedentes bacterium]|nr:hypothetical protein [Candidatus Hydrogenedentota bacterium]
MTIKFKADKDIDLSSAVAIRDTFRQMNDDAISTARELQKIADTPGFVWLCSLVRERRREIGVASVYNEDVKLGPQYWRGYLEGAADLEELISGLLTHGKQTEVADETVRSQILPGEGGVLAGE